MSRAETTAMLSKLVEKRLKNRVSYWMTCTKNTRPNSCVTMI
jgi:hypothetical protein